MLKNETRTLLKSLIPINNSMIIEDEMFGSDEFKSIIFKANLKELEEGIETFGIFDVSNFLGSLDLLENPEISIENNSIVATDESSTLKFITSDPSSLDIDINPKVIDTTLAVDSILEFGLTSELLQKIKKASAVFKTFDSLFIVKESEKITLKLGAKDSFSKSNNSFSIAIAPSLNTGENDFELAIPLESILKLPVFDYQLLVKYNSDKDVFRVVCKNALLTFILSLKK